MCCRVLRNHKAESGNFPWEAGKRGPEMPCRGDSSKMGRMGTRRRWDNDCSVTKVQWLKVTYLNRGMKGKLVPRD